MQPIDFSLAARVTALDKEVSELKRRCRALRQQVRACRRGMCVRRPLMRRCLIRLHSARKRQSERRWSVNGGLMKRQLLH